MSRIDEAMRRSGKSTAANLKPDEADDALVSPWGVREAPAGIAGAASSHGDDQAGDRLARIIGEVHPPVSRRMTEPPLSGSELHAGCGFSAAWMERLVISPTANPLHVEQFRQLAATLHHARAEANIQAIMVTSAAA